MEQATHFDQNQLFQFELDVKDFCLSNGLVCLSKNATLNQEIQNHDSAIPLPVTLVPTKLPAKDFQYAFDIQQDFNRLIFSISNDYEFLKETLKNVILVDDFTRNLWNVYETVYKEGINQQISLAILRNDFMVDQNKENENVKLSQIEINTISCSFGAATSNVSRLHRYVLKRMNHDKLLEKHAKNENVSMIAQAIFRAWKLYDNKNSKVLFLVSNNERNIGDQRLLEYKCHELDSNLIVVRYSLTDVARLGRLDEDKKRLIIDGNEIAVVYFRSGYDPKDYLSEKEWNSRLMIERSYAIKCPNISTHLVGAKIVQQALSEPNVVERFISDKNIADSLRATFVDMHSITDHNLDNILQLISQHCKDYVLKPQREGGGNNIYKEDIIKFVDSIQDKKELMGYILMKLVRPYVSENYVIKSGVSIQKQKLISELGVFGFYIADGNKLLLNETCGYLLRSKPFDCNEGGVASGYSALDSVYLE